VLIIDKKTPPGNRGGRQAGEGQNRYDRCCLREARWSRQKAIPTTRISGRSQSPLTWQWPYLWARIRPGKYRTTNNIAIFISAPPGEGSRGDIAQNGDFARLLYYILYLYFCQEG